MVKVVKRARVLFTSTAKNKLTIHVQIAGPEWNRKYGFAGDFFVLANSLAMDHVRHVIRTTEKVTSLASEKVTYIECHIHFDTERNKVKIILQEPNTTRLTLMLRVSQDGSVTKKNLWHYVKSLGA